MKPSDTEITQLRRLISGMLDGKLDEEGRRSLNALLLKSTEARRFYREQMKLHARLHLEYERAGGAMPLPGARPRGRVAVFTRGLLWAAAACIALIAVFAWKNDERELETFATLNSARAARWVGSNLPTTEKSRLSAGTLQLDAGIAVIRFDSGAEVSLEAPAELDLIDAMNCRIRRGTAVANVPPSAIGFRIETPSVRVVDHGTRFSVSVDPQTGGTLTQVFDGWVEVQNPATGDVVALSSGQRNSIMGGETGPVTEGWQEQIQPKNGAPRRRGPEWKMVTSSQDAYIGPILEGDSEVLLYLKNGEPGFNRKAYLGFDLTGIDSEQIGDAELSLHFAPTGLGLASHVPDSTFAVYGLLPSDAAAWEETSLRDYNAPGNIRDAGSGLDPEAVRKLGTFTVAQGVQSGRFGIDGNELVDFLRGRAGTSVTLIVVRETAEFEKNGLVHGIASRRHPELPAPTLAVRLVRP